MSDALLLDDLRAFMLQHQGRANAVPRRTLLAHLHSLGHTLTDRSLRRAYAEIPNIGYSVEGEHRGLYWISTTAERREVEGNQHSKSMAMLGREKKIREAGDTAQGSLF